MRKTKSTARVRPRSGLAYTNIWYTRIRWLVIGAALLPSLALRLIFGNPYQVIKPILIITSVVTLYNLVFWYLITNRRSRKSLRQIAIAQILADLIGITYLIYRGGGIQSHSAILYTVPILASGVIFQGRTMIRVAVGAIFLYSLTVNSQYFGWLPTTVNNFNYDKRAFFTLTVFTNSAILIIAVIGRYFIRLIRQDTLKIKRQKSKVARLLLKNRTDTANFKVRTSALFNSIGEGLIVVNEYGIITDVNQATLNMLGFTRRELIGKWFPKAIVGVDEDGSVVPVLKRPIVEALQTGKPVRTQSFYLDKKSEPIPVFQIAAPFIVGGKPTGGVLAFRNIQEELEFQKAQDDFVSLASHQLRTPATAVKNFIGLLKEGFAGHLTKEQAEFANRAYENNERQLALINDLLNVARTESGQLIIKKGQHDVVKLVKEVIKEQAQVVANRRQKITIKAPKKPLMANLDKEYIKMVVENLINNASKYTPQKGRITVAIEKTPATLVIKVADTGVGIAEIDRERLFKKFSRIENRLSDTVEGTGVGLYLVKQIAHLHRGKVDVKSKAGKGSVFTVTLPQSKRG